MNDTSARRIRAVILQLNPVVGAIEANTDAAIRAAREWHGRADLLVLTECFVTGYPVEDLVHSESFLGSVTTALTRIRREMDSGGLCPMVIGAPVHTNGGGVSNSAFLVAPNVYQRVDKHQLPNYGPFDEKRNFVRGRLPAPVEFMGAKLGILVCEDLWLPEGAAELADKGADVIISLNGSPWQADKDELRKAVAAERNRETGLPIIYVNQVGGQDELVFDGASFVIGRDGRLVTQAASFAEDVVTMDIAACGDGTWDVVSEVPARPVPDRLGGIYSALVLSVRDYIRKNGFKGAMLGLSGGIDSAVVASVATDALGPDNVWAITMPYRWTSDLSMSEAHQSAANLGIRLDTIPIIDAVESTAGAIAAATSITPAKVALENMQARARGLILMTLSNQVGHEREGYMVLSTGNKSEVSVGYATLYGDMCGGLNVLKDVYKTDVYAIARWRNGNRLPGFLGPQGNCVPVGTIERAPSAELAPGQKDQDSLPPYDVLDGILRLMVDGWKGNDEIAAEGYDPATVRKVRGLLDRAEYKRRQGAPGPRVSAMSFGRDRRVPITNAWREA